MALVLPSEGLYLVRMLEYITALAEDRNAKMSTEINRLTLPSFKERLKETGESSVADLSVRTPYIPFRVDDVSLEMVDQLHEKVIDPMLTGINDFTNTFFPCNEDLYQEELTSLTNMLNGGFNTQLNEQQRLEFVRQHDAVMTAALSNMNEAAVGASAAGYPISPGFMHGQVNDIMTEAMKQSVEQQAAIANQRLDGELGLLKTAIGSILEARRTAVAAAISYLSSRLALLTPGLSIASASVSQQNRLIGAISTWIQSLQNVEALKLSSNDEVKRIAQGITTNDLTRKLGNAELVQRQIYEIVGVLASQASSALNALSAQGSVQHQVR